MKRFALFFTPFLAIAIAIALTGCSKHDHDHDHADHDDHDEHHDQSSHAEEDHDDHDHEKRVPGPNGGRLITAVEPHLEFLVTDDRKIRITAVNDDNQPVAVTTQSVNVIAGDRTNPTRLSFAKDGEGLLSAGPIPDGNNFPLVLTIKTAPGSDPVREKFNLNLSSCPTCDYKEYACICGHDEEEHEEKE